MNTWTWLLNILFKSSPDIWSVALIHNHKLREQFVCVCSEIYALYWDFTQG